MNTLPTIDYRRVLTAAIALTLGSYFMSDELFGQLVSPEVAEDRRVTFRFKAPKATSVKVKGLDGYAPQSMEQDDDGTWQVTIGPLPAKLYSYTFDVDGAEVVDTRNRNVKEWLGIESMVLVPGTPPLLHEQQRVPHGTVHHHIYDSKTAECERSVVVYTPPGYDPDRAKPYPTVFLLHGYGDDQTAWTRVGQVHQIADNLLSQGKIEPMVIVMPNGHPLPIANATEFDSYADQNVRTLNDDLRTDLASVLNEYHLSDSADQRAIVGLSMGGGQSIMIGLWNPAEFAWIGAFSAAAPVKQLDERFPKLSKRRDAANANIRLLWMACGKEDRLSGRNQELAKWLTEKSIKHVYMETDGGHDWMVWRRYISEFLPQLFR